MAIKITKQLAVVEDITFGSGTVVQKRDINGTGPEDVIYHKVNASHIPTVIGGTIEEELILRPKESDLNLAAKADIVTVLTKTQLTPYTPVESYNPATKKYVDDTVVSIGSGDMAKAVYDTDTSGVVDNSEALGGLDGDLFVASRGIFTDCDAITISGIYEGNNVANAPVQGLISLTHDTAVTLQTQKVYSFLSERTFVRYYSSAWSEWFIDVNSTDIVNNLNADPTDTTSVLGAYQGRLLDEAKLEADEYAQPTVGGTLKARYDVATETLYLRNDGTNA